MEDTRFGRVSLSLEEPGARPRGGILYARPAPMHLSLHGGVVKHEGYWLNDALTMKFSAAINHESSAQRFVSAPSANRRVIPTCIRGSGCLEPSAAMPVPWWFFLDAWRWATVSQGYRNIVAGPLFSARLPVRHAIRVSESGWCSWLPGSR
jgi:hypothetical protein